jgi:hypothetical protein
MSCPKAEEKKFSFYYSLDLKRGETWMIYEQRIYTLQPGKVPEFLEIFEQEMQPVVIKHLHMVGFWYTEIGELNQVVHMWAFEDLNHRATQRQKFYTDPALADVFPKLREIIVKQESKILIPAPFSPLK